MAVQVEFNNQTLDKRCMSTVQLLLDIETLAHTDYMTGTLNSGIPYLIEVRTPNNELRKNRPHCTLVTMMQCGQLPGHCQSQPRAMQVFLLACAKQLCRAAGVSIGSSL